MTKAPSDIVKRLESLTLASPSTERFVNQPSQAGTDHTVDDIAYSNLVSLVSLASL